LEGDAEAQIALGEMYAKGQGTLKNEVEAISWFRKAAQQGLAQRKNEAPPASPTNQSSMPSDNQPAAQIPNAPTAQSASAAMVNSDRTAKEQYPAAAKELLVIQPAAAVVKRRP
jgi:TPR repeat protein